ncbi:1,6-anhydro-N-acetylmuramyl-L-alanine amidase AmpD [Salinicola salarius]|uniref:1,6-anhydro-N-acetylmuramyl-L-alanine amidase AmpD n=1 Tax=Salinicola salarius TaxID=430457 RepID=UPI0023E4173D|nr:1,6-anhydro-N-acetylmuramyl-L-alanine amidase AmpD [Salinicola salarius]MDF3919262.1 1,6-anhydro-N-acetylmuramyl-L-alanine amidase AmpD [Salinicola salarius]
MKYQNVGGGDSAVIDGHWLGSARRVTSPNANERPAGEISAVVLHGISLPPGEFGGDAIERLFTNTLDPDGHPAFAAIASLRVSAHLLIRRDGECVQFVPFDRRAWHAGESRWLDERLPRQGKSLIQRQRQLREGLNDFTVGIELEGTDEIPYREAQYRALARVLGALMQRYPAISSARITSHAHIAPLRKTDPGPAFDWAYLRRCLAEIV